MTISVLFVINMSMRIGCTCFSIATSAAECGVICPLTGLGDLIFGNVLIMQDPGSSILSSLNLCSLQLGIFRSSGMVELSDERMLLLVHGNLNLYMIFLF